MRSPTVLIAAAAVADYRPVRVAHHKLKKTAERLDSIELTETVDILAAMGERKGARTVIGFAAETDDVVRHAREKLARKGCDALVANDVSRTDSGFGTDDIAIFWVTPEGAEELPLMPKRFAAREILTRVADLRRHPEDAGSIGMS